MLDGGGGWNRLQAPGSYFCRETPGSFLEGANICQNKKNCSMVVG